MDKPHEQRLARLQWELEQRRGQTQLFDKLTQEKESVADMISEQERKLASLAPRINSILEVSFIFCCMICFLTCHNPFMICDFLSN